MSLHARRPLPFCLSAETLAKADRAGVLTPAVSFRDWHNKHKGNPITPSGNNSINQIRRRDRAVVDDNWIRGFLREAQYAVVATESEGQPFLNPLLFVYDEQSNSIYFHTGREGRIFANISSNPRVCLNTCHMGELVADTEAWSFTVGYDSVNVFGKAVVLEDSETATRALRLLLAKYFPHLRYGEDYNPITTEQLAPTAVYELKIESWSAKRHTPKP